MIASLFGKDSICLFNIVNFFKCFHFYSTESFNFLLPLLVICKPAEFFSAICKNSLSSFFQSWVERFQNISKIFVCVLWLILNLLWTDNPLTSLSLMSHHRGILWILGYLIWWGECAFWLGLDKNSSCNFTHLIIKRMFHTLASGSMHFKPFLLHSFPNSRFQNAHSHLVSSLDESGPSGWRENSWDY